MESINMAQVCVAIYIYASDSPMQGADSSDDDAVVTWARPAPEVIYISSDESDFADAPASDAEDTDWTGRFVCEAAPCAVGLLERLMCPESPLGSDPEWSAAISGPSADAAWPANLVYPPPFAPEAMIEALFESAFHPFPEQTGMLDLDVGMAAEITN